MYLQQRCFDGSVNKTIFKKASLQQWVANTYTWDFPYVKFRIAALIRYWRKQSGSGIWTIIRTGLKSQSVRPCLDISRHATFHPYQCTRFWVILLTDRETDKQTWAKTFTSSLSEVNIQYTVKYGKHYNTDRDTDNDWHGVVKLHNTFPEVLQLLICLLLNVNCVNLLLQT